MVLVFAGDKVSTYDTYNTGRTSEGATITVEGKQLWRRQTQPFKIIDEDIVTDNMNRYGEISPGRHFTILSEDGDELDLRGKLMDGATLAGFYKRDKSLSRDVR